MIQLLYGTAGKADARFVRLQQIDKPDIFIPWNFGGEDFQRRKAECHPNKTRK